MELSSPTRRATTSPIDIPGGDRHVAVMGPHSHSFKTDPFSSNNSSLVSKTSTNPSLESPFSSKSLLDCPPVRAVKQSLESEANIHNSSDTTGGQDRKNVMNVADFPTDELILMISALLNRIITANDETTDPSQQLAEDAEDELLAPILAFYGKNIPEIAVVQYLERIQKYCPTTNDIFLSLLVYFDRISRNYGHLPDRDGRTKQMFVMDSGNIHRLLITGVTVCTKFLSDFFYSNSRYAKVGGISLQELNHLELQFLVLCDFKLLVSVEEMQKYADLLYKFWNDQ
ncbi:pcl7p [Saccharomyces arboricola H-6]|uniref:Pcl7p n=1 Tax=Saccharomyces arboricola (strain H-6 / AS 2.3317 / CBS 10644) TaxID=1160507 RepID=J8Q6S1_SACAR|nr:pcl7p [Saccharomyces arboricola H-6]